MKSSYLTVEVYLLEVVENEAVVKITSSWVVSGETEMALNFCVLYRKTYQPVLLWGGDIDMPHTDKDKSCYS